MTSAEIAILRNRLVPSPANLDFTGDGFYTIKDNCKVQIYGDDSEFVKTLFQKFWGVVPEINSLPVQEKLSAESYQIRCTENTLEIHYSEIAGLRYALNTLRQLAEPQRCKRMCEEHILPVFQLKDAPSMGFRGIHLCVFPETAPIEIEKKIRLAAFWKFNYAVIEFWGTYRFEAFPEFCWEEKLVDKETVLHWVKTARDCGITLIPQFNILGHAAAARNRSDKHVVLDLHPEFAPLFEPEGWTWCLSNPETLKVLDGMMDELLDLFENPPYFHIGCDEADDLGHCAVCRKETPRILLYRHLSRIAERLSKRNCRPIMWHDMLLERDDDRWYHFTANGHSTLESAKLCQELPRNIIIADWGYGWPDDDREWPLPDLDYFKDSGFDVLVSPWRSMRGIRGYAQAVVKKKLSGMLVTTWHTASGNDFFRIFHHAAKGAWEGSDYAAETLSDRLSFTRHLRWMVQDSNVTKYADTGSVTEQLESITHI